MADFDVNMPNDFMKEILHLSDSGKLCEEMLSEASPILVESMKKKARRATGAMAESIKATKPASNDRGYFTAIRPTGRDRDGTRNAEKMAHIKRSLDQMMMTLRGQYQVEGGAITFTLRDSGNGEKELCTSVHIDDMPLSRYHAINRDIGTMLRNYGKLNNRNHKKDVPHLRKHAMHLIRLFLMGLDILEGRGINTFRADEQEMLLAIRSGDIPIEEVFCMNEEYEKKLKLAYEESVLPDLPNNDAINDLLEKCYRIGYESGKFA